MQDNEEDFVSLTKNDPKYQTLPYNAKLFTPFATKHEQDQFENSMQQMQIIQQDQTSSSQHQSQSAATAQLQFHVQQYRQQQQQQQLQPNNQHYNQVNHESNSAKDDPSAPNNANNGPSNNERIQSYNNKNNLHLTQLQSFLSQQQISNHNVMKISSTASNTTSNVATSTNGPQQSVQQQGTNSNNATNGQVGMKGPVENGGGGVLFPIVRPSNFLPTGAPASSPSGSSSTSNSGSAASSTFGGNVQQNGFNGGQVNICTHIVSLFHIHSSRLFFHC